MRDKWQFYSFNQVPEFGTIGIWNSVSFFLTPEVLPFAGIELAEKPGFLIVVAQHIEHKCDKKWG